MATDMQSKLSTLKESAAAAKAARHDESLARYHEMVSASGNGTELDVDEVVAILADLDKGISDFDRDVEKKVHRIALKVIADRAAQATKDAEAAEAKIAELRVKWAKAVAPIEAEINGTRTFLADCQQAIRSAAGAERELAASAWPETVVHEKLVLQQMAALQPGREGIEDHLRSAQAALTIATRLSEDTHQPPTSRKHNAEIARHQVSEVKRWEAEAGKLEARRMELDAELRAVHAEKLEP